MEVYSLDHLELARNGLIPLACFDRIHQVALDTRQFNEAGQWDIVNLETRWRVTLTMACFWTEHIWKWIRFRYPVWRPYSVDEEIGR